ncbi:MAG TPA: protein kinase family protein [Pilimelia sp.]|nr:protein kinase family protein [Pilimelia sp.]
MTQVGQSHEAAETAPPVLTAGDPSGDAPGAEEADAGRPSVGAPTVGEILAERYQLEEHINDDSAGRQVWRGIDVILRRPVAVVLRYPGGDAAAEMLQAAVAASRVVHPNLVGVYDAIDEDDRAYVVREWVDGQSLRELTVDGPLDAPRATSIVHAVAGAVAAVHSTGMVHGNVHPGTVLIGNDGRVVLADARADAEVTTVTDVRHLGGVLYFALTGHWPHAEAGPSSLPDAVRDTTGAIAAPRQMRAGIPTYLDDLAMDLLDPRLAPPAADVLSAELGRLDQSADERFFDDAGPLRFAGEETEHAPERSRPAGPKLAVGIAVLLVVGIVGTILGLRAVAGTSESPNVANPDPPASTPADGSGDGAAADPKPISISADRVRIVDPGGSRSELENADRMVDGDGNTAWASERYRDQLNVVKPGMGILLDLGEERQVTTLRVQFASPGAEAQIWYGDTDPGNSSSGDKEIYRSYAKLGRPTVANSTLVFDQFDPDATYRYLMVWLTKMPAEGRGYKVEVQEIQVAGP